MSKFLVKPRPNSGTDARSTRAAGKIPSVGQRTAILGELTGDRANGSLAKYNIAEILVDQGHLAEAEDLLAEASRVWRSTGDDYLLGFCLIQLGRVA